MDGDAKYIEQVTKKYRRAVNVIASKLARNFAATLPESSFQELSDKVFYILYTNWSKEFITPLEPTVQKWTKTLYQRYRKDTSIFGGMPNIPKVDYSLSDFRAMQYFKDSDMFYLGKFITDPSTTKKINQYLRKEYLEGGNEIGRSPESLEQFKNNFAGVLDGEDWKIRRVIDTTVSRERVTGALHYMEQAGVAEYEIVEAMDRLTCPYCEQMNGRRFQVQTSYEKVENLDFTDGENLIISSPFVGSVIPDPNAIATMTTADLEALGVDMPPYHCSCRGTIVAVF